MGYFTLTGIWISDAIGTPGGGDEGASECTIATTETYDQLDPVIKKWYEENACKMEELAIGVRDN